MKLKYGLLLLVAVALLSPVLGGDADAKVKVGDRVDSFTLPDARSGEQRSLDSLKGPKGVAVIFVATDCPYSNAFNGIMASLAEEYQAKGVSLVGINSNKTEPREAVRKHAEENGLSFAVLKDDGNVVADRLGAQVTPEVFLLDSDLVLQYHGTIGNSKQPTVKKEEARADDVRPALEAVVNGGEVAVRETKAFGCTIKR
jgi:peroxiredoxin